MLLLYIIFSTVLIILLRFLVVLETIPFSIAPSRLEIDILLVISRATEYINSIYY